MKSKFTREERKFLKRYKNDSSNFKSIAILIVSLLFFGILIDAFNGFHIIRKAKSIFMGILGLFILALFYIVGEGVSEWINSKDHVSHPLHKRVFHLLLLLLSVGIVMTLAYFIFKYLGWEISWHST